MIFATLLALGVIAILGFRKYSWSLVFTLLLSIGMIAYALDGLWHGVGPMTIAGTVGISPLRAWFLLVLGLVATMSSWYRWGYHDQGQATSLFMPFFLLSMMTVILADNVWVFMSAWEAMTITSFFLVTRYHQRPQVLKSGYIYLVMSQVSAMLILSGFMVMGTALHSLNFSVWALYASTLSLPLKSLIFGLLALGFGMKSGVIPFHVWLPRAHPVAPAPVSSLMSGAMIKLGIFGMMQFLLFDLGQTARIWPLLILAAGALSSLLGVLYALMEHDLKRLLAYHSIENIGIILLGLGVMGVGIDWHLPGLVALGLIASLFHTLNHAIFKSQLFLAAGAVEQHTGTLDADHLGGLMRKIPGIAIGFIAGSLAISGLPPFNGFVSEWLTFRGLLGLASHWTGPMALYGLGLAMVLGLTGALAGLCFVKASGVIFLGEPRREVAQHRIPASMVWPILGLAGFTLILGVVPQPLLHLLANVDPRYPVAATSLLLPVKTLVIAALLLAVSAGLIGFSRALSVRTVPRWSTGRIPDASMQYTSASFSKSIRTTFALIYRPHRQLVGVGGLTPDFPEQFIYRGGTRPVWDRYLYQPLYALIWHLAHLSSRIQAGPVRLYLAYLLGTVGLMLAILH